MCRDNEKNPSSIPGDSVDYDVVHPDSRSLGRIVHVIQFIISKLDHQPSLQLL